MESNGKHTNEAKALLGDLKEKGQEMFEKLNRKKIKDISDNISGYTKKNPLKSIFLAGLIGLFLGFLLKRKK